MNEKENRKILAKSCAFITKQFIEHKCNGIECELLHRMGREALLVKEGEYGGPWSEALSYLCDVKSIQDMDGNWIYNVFRLKE